MQTNSVQSVLRDSGVDDLLKSVESVGEAKFLSQELNKLMQLGRIHLHKWMTNSSEDLNILSQSERAIKTDFDELPVQHTHGLKWNVPDDC